eukprot:681274-Amphidinium_carterae.2
MGCGRQLHLWRGPMSILRKACVQLGWELDEHPSSSPCSCADPDRVGLSVVSIEELKLDEIKLRLKHALFMRICASNTIATIIITIAT